MERVSEWVIVLDSINLVLGVIKGFIYFLFLYYKSIIYDFKLCLLVFLRIFVYFSYDFYILLVFSIVLIFIY